MGTFTVFPISLDHMLFSTVSKLYAFPTLARYWEGDLASMLYFLKLTSCWSSTVFISFSCCSFFGIKTQNYSFSSASYIASYLHMSISFLNSTRLLLFGAYAFPITISCQYNIYWDLHLFPVSWSNIPVSGLSRLSLLRISLTTLLKKTLLFHSSYMLTL